MGPWVTIRAQKLIDGLRFGADGLIPVVAQQWDSAEVLMLAWMDAEAVRRTLDTGRGTYWSRSRQQYWVKGETSGHTQTVKEVRIDCDGDALSTDRRPAGPGVSHRTAHRVSTARRWSSHERRLCAVHDT